MSVHDTVALAATGLLFSLVALVLLSRTLGKLRRVLLVARGPTASLADPDPDRDALYAVTATEYGNLVLAVDRFGYWCKRNLADGPRSNVYTVLGSVLLEHDREDVRSGSDRRRVGLLHASPLSVHEDDRRLEVELAGAMPTQRLSANGALVPWLVVLAIVALVVGLLFNVVFLAVLGVGAELLGSTAIAAIVAGVAAVLALIVATWYRNGRSPLGAWDAIAPAEDGSVPERVRTAATEADPEGTGLVYRRDLDEGERLYVLGTATRREDGRVFVTDGVATTRGRPFLAGRATVGVLWNLGLFFATGAAGVGMLWLVVQGLL